MDTLIQDLRYAIRGLCRTPGFTAAAVLTLALGIGATTAMLSIVDAVLLRPVPFPEADQLLMIWETDRASGTSHEPASFPDFLDFRQRSRRVSELAAFAAGEASLTPERGEPSRVAALYVTDRFFPMLGITPSIGRTFDAPDDRPGGGNVVLISEELWERQFGRDPQVIGRSFRLDDRPRTIIGVLPAGVDFGIRQILRSADYGRAFADNDVRTGVDVFVPLQGDSKRFPRETHPIFLLGRLAPGATAQGAQEELSAIAVDLEKTYPENEARGIFSEPLHEVILGPVQPALLVLLAAVGLVFLIACVNVSHLLLVRGTGRGREIAIKRALGVGTPRLTRQFVVESAVLMLVSTTLGVLVAHAALQLVLLTAPPDIPRLAAVAIDQRVLTVTLCTSLVVAFFFGLVPIFQNRGADLQTMLKVEGIRGVTGGRERGVTRSTLVVGEIALAVVLVIAAGLLIKSFWRLQQVNPGFDVLGVIKAEFQLPSSRYPNAQELQRFNANVLARVSTLPGVESAAMAAEHPLAAGFTNSFAVVGREAEARDWPEISVRRVTPAYFRTLRIPLVQGRVLAESDAATAPAVVLVNEETVRRFFPKQDPIGHQIAFWGVRRTIVGVVGSERIRGLGEPPPIAVYLPFAQVPSDRGVLMVRTAGNADTVIPPLVAAMREIEPGLTVFAVQALEETLSRSVGEQRFTMQLIGVFAGMALVLAVIGIHGVQSCAVAQRVREIGIRIALGAEPQRITRLVLAQSARLTAIGLAIGLILAALFARSLAGLLFGVTASDPSIFAAVSCVLGAVAMLATWLPARRAARVDPLVTLRYE